MGAFGVPELETGAAGENLSARVHKCLHLAFDGKLFRVESFGFDALGQQEGFGGVALFEGEDAQAKDVPNGFCVGGIDDDAEFHDVLTGKYLGGCGFWPTKP